MNALIVMPVTYGPYGEACLASMAPEVRERTVVVDNTGETNLGAAGSYNVGARRVLDEGHDWLLTLSATVRFGPAGGVDMLERLDGVDGRTTWVVEAEMPVGWHWLAWSRPMFERVGIWDEQFHPCYAEDADIAHRIGIAAREAGIADRGDGAWWEVFAADAWIMMQGYSAHMAGIDPSQEDLWASYERKWGGRSGHEQWDRPYGSMPLDYVGPPPG